MNKYYNKKITWKQQKNSKEPQLSITSKKTFAECNLCESLRK